VLAAFGVRGDTTLMPLAGGLEQSAWRADDVVLKPVQAFNPGEGEWVATVLDVIVEDGFRVIKPVRAADGRWVEAGWTAWRWFDGTHERTNWRDVVAAADAFHRALPDAIARAGLDAHPAWLDARTHRWARSEATVWHGAPVPPTINVNDTEWDLYHRAVALGPPLTDDERAGSQVIHGDVASNVLLLDDGTGHALIDMSPGWRPASSTGAQIGVEAVSWFRAPPATLDGFASADLGRACAFRLLCGLQMSADWSTDFPGELRAWTRTLDLIGA
jgi:hypothetical protein